MLHLATDTNCHKVGVECLDDVVSEKSDGVVLEQAKHSLNPAGNPFTERSKNLWRTLEIWTDAIDAHAIDLPTTKFVLVTNQTVPEDCLAREIGAADDVLKAQECVKKLRGVKDLSEDVAAIAKRVLDRKDADICSLLMRVGLADSQTTALLRDQIIRGLHLSGPTAQQTVQSLYGWLKDAVVASWESKTAAWIVRENFERQYHQILRSLNQQKFRERAESMVPIESHNEEAAKAKTFVQQLGLIFDDSNNQVVISAVKDYLRAVSERTRLYEEGDITREQLNAFDESLQGRWRNIFDGHLMLSQPKDDETKVRVGRQVYFETIKFQGSLAGYLTEQPYLTSGSYHKLADAVSVGWHPDHEQLKRKN